MVTTIINALRQMLPDKLVNDFQVPKTLIFKMWPSAQPSCDNSFICLRIKKSFPILKADHLTPGEPENGLFNNKGMSRQVLRSYLLWF